MPRSLAQAKKAAGIEDRLYGEVLKRQLIDRRIPVMITGVKYGEREYGPTIEVDIDLNGALDNAADTLSFGSHPDRDPELLAMGDATVSDPYGPMILGEYGARKFQKFVDASEQLPF